LRAVGGHIRDAGSHSEGGKQYWKFHGHELINLSAEAKLENLPRYPALTERGSNNPAHCKKADLSGG
jgi:hypothetical protein